MDPSPTNEGGEASSRQSPTKSAARKSMGKKNNQDDGKKQEGVVPVGSNKHQDPYNAVVRYLNFKEYNSAGAPIGPAPTEVELNSGQFDSVQLVGNKALKEFADNHLSRSNSNLARMIYYI